MPIELSSTAKTLAATSLTSVAPTSSEVAVTKKIHTEYLINGWQLYCLGVATVLGHQLFGWNKGLDRGFWEYFMTVGVLGEGYICLAICLAHITANVSLPGGVFSYVRCVCGPFSGFLVGVCTAIEYVFYITAAVSLLGDALSIVINIGGFLRPLYFLGFYVVAIGIQNGVGQRLSVYVYILLGILTLIVILCYCIQTADKASLDGDNLPQSFDSPTHFMYAMHLGGWFFVGQDSLPLLSSRLAEPKRTLPRVLVALSLTCMCCALGVLLMSVSLPSESKDEATTGAVSAASSMGSAYHDVYSNNLPLVFGYMERWNISYQRSMYIMCLGLFSTAYGFVYFLTRHLQTLASAGILPSPLASLSSRTNTPILASIAGCFISYILLLFVYYNVPDFITSVFRVVYMAACVKYIFIFRAYIIMQLKPSPAAAAASKPSNPANNGTPSQTKDTNASSQTASPTSSVFSATHSWLRNVPWGIVVALIGSLIFAVAFASLVYYQTNDNWSAIVFGGCLALCVLYYSLYGRHEESFSDEERDMIMKKFVYNAKRRKNPKHFPFRFIKRHMHRLRAPFEPILPNPLMLNETNATESEESKAHDKTALTKGREEANQSAGATGDRLQVTSEATGGADPLAAPQSPLSPQMRDQFMSEMFNHMQMRYNDMVRSGGLGSPMPGTPYPGITPYPSTPYPSHPGFGTPYYSKPYPGTPYPTLYPAAPFQDPYASYPSNASPHPFGQMPFQPPAPASHPTLPFSNPTVTSQSQPRPQTRVSFVAPEVIAQNQKEIADLFSPSPRAPAPPPASTPAPASAIASSSAAATAVTPVSAPAPAPLLSSSPVPTSSSPPPAVVPPASAVSTTPAPTPTVILSPTPAPAPAPEPAPAPTPRPPLFDLPPPTGPRLPSAQSFQPMGFGQFAWSGLN